MQEAARAIGCGRGDRVSLAETSAGPTPQLQKIGKKPFETLVGAAGFEPATPLVPNAAAQPKK